MAAIKFFTVFGSQIYDLSGSGVGFYGPGNFGAAVQVGQFQDNTYVTDPNGAVNGPKANNVKYISAGSGQVAIGDTRALQAVPNQLATLNIQFTNGTPVKTQNAQFFIYDRNNVNAPASGVTTMVAELVHPWATQTPNGSGDTAWSHLGGSGGLISGVLYDLPLTLVDSPGSGGWSPNGSATVDIQHDFYLAMSASPDTVGSKTSYSCFVTLEYI